MYVHNFMAIYPIVVGIFCLKPTNVNVMMALEEKSGDEIITICPKIIVMDTLSIFVQNIMVSHAASKTKDTKN